MTEKGREKPSSSLVIVSRRMLVAGIAGISLFSFGLGYFFGYGGSSANKMVRQVEADNKIGPSEERTVLDSSGKPTMVPPPATPGIIPKEPPLITRPNNEVASAPRIREELPKSSEEKKPDGSQPPEKKAMNIPEKNAVGAEKKPDADVSGIKSKDSGSGKAGKKDSVVMERKQQSMPAAKKPAHKPAFLKSRHAYAVQVGAFSDPAKAKRLQDQLSAKGYKASITAFSPASGKTLSRVRIGHYTTKKEAQELASDLKSQDMEGLVVYGSR